MLDRYTTALQTLLGDPKTIGILGYGMEGRSSYTVMRQLYPDTPIIVVDQNAQVEVPDHPLTAVAAGSDYMDALADCDVVLRSPGIKLEVGDYDGKVTSQAALFTQVCRDRIIGVTGTKGKSTTTTLIHHLLSGTYETALVGNIGVPPLEALTAEYDYYVCEYSCQQLSDMEVSPRYSLLLNLYPEHLDYYASVEEYYNTKRNIYQHQDSTDHCYSVSETASPGLQLALGTTYRIAEKRLLATEDCIEINSQKIPYTDALAGDHNKLNQLFAIAVCLQIGLEETDIVAPLQSFTGLPHRLETVYEADGLRYVNDSISTIPQSTIAAIQAYDDVALVLIGGYDRGIDYSPLVVYLEQSLEVEVVLFSAVGERLSTLLQRPFVLKPSFAEGTKYTLEHHPSKGTILMSPAASSYDEFRSFVHRGDAFRQMVTAYFNEN